MIRVTHICKGLGGGKHFVNGHLLTITKVGSLVSRHAAWAWSRGECVGGCWPKRAPAGPEVGSQILSPHQPTSHRRFCRALWVTSTVHLSTRRSWSLLLTQSKHLLCCWCSCLALSSQSLHTSLWCKPHSTVESVAARLHEAEEPSSTYLHCLKEEPECVSINSLSV